MTNLLEKLREFVELVERLANPANQAVLAAAGGAPAGGGGPVPPAPPAANPSAANSPTPPAGGNVPPAVTPPAGGNPPTRWQKIKALRTMGWTNFTLTEKTACVLALLGVVLFSTPFIPLVSTPGFVFFIGFLPLAGASWLLYKGEKLIPTDPKTRAIPTPFGKPKKQLIDSRVVFAYQGFPLWEGLIPIPGGPIIEDLVFENVAFAAEDTPKEVKTGRKTPSGKDVMKLGAAPRAGGEGKMMLALVYQVNEGTEHAYEFVRTGREAAVKKIISDALDQVLREYSAFRSYERVRSEGPAINKLILAKMKKESDHLKQELSGITIKQLYFKKVTAEGSLKDATENLAREIQERRSDALDIQTGIEITENIIKASEKADGKNKKLSYSEAGRVARVERERAEELNVRGLEKNPLGGVGLLAGTANRPRKGRKP